MILIQWLLISYFWIGMFLALLLVVCVFRSFSICGGPVFDCLTSLGIFAQILGVGRLVGCWLECSCPRAYWSQHFIDICFMGLEMSFWSLLVLLRSGGSSSIVEGWDLASVFYGCRVEGEVVVCGCGLLIGFTMVGRASDSVTALTWCFHQWVSSWCLNCLWLCIVCLFGCFPVVVHCEAWKVPFRILRPSHWVES